MKIRIIAFLLLAVGAVQADPGWVNSDPASPETFAANAAIPVSPFKFEEPQSEAMGAPLAPLSIGNAADLITPEIQFLADGLQHDPIRVFNYVYNHIDFQAYYGSKKGAAMTLMEGKGNQFDTCALLVSLLRASGFDAEYRIGAAAFSYATLRTWLGLSAYPLPDKTDAQIIALFGGGLPSGFSVLQGRQLLNTHYFLTSRGYPIVSYVNGETYVFDHVWIQVTVGGNSYYLDPSLKGHFDFTPIDFLTAAGYDRSAFLNAIGGTAGTGSIGANSIKQIGQQAVASQMTALCTSAANWIRANKPNDSIDVLTQGRRIQEREITDFAQAYTVSAYLTGWHPSIISATAIPESYMSKLTLTLGVYNYGTKTFTTTYYTGTIKTPELMGKKLALTFSGNTGTIHLEDAVWRAQSIPNATVDIKTDFTHDHYEWKWNGSAYVKQNVGRNNSTDVLSYRKGDSFAHVFSYGFDVNGKLLRKRQEKLDGYLRAGMAESSREVRTEVLNVMGLTWLHETELSDLIVTANSNVSHAIHHRFGRVSQEEAFYIDMFSQRSSNQSRSSVLDLSVVWQVAMMFQSALEHAVIEQTQGISNQAASTIKILHLANQANVRIFRANSSNWQTGANIRSLLTGYTGTLGTAMLAYMDASVAAGAAILVPETGNLSLGGWSGSGYASQSANLVEMRISGGYNGGYNSQVGIVLSGPLVQLGFSEPGYYQNGSSVQDVPYTGLGFAKYFAADPVDMATGSFVLNKQDLQLGGASPRGLSFARHYDGNRRYDASPGLGFGWTHNCHGRAVSRTSVRGALGVVTSYQMVPWLIAAAVARDVYGSGTTAKTWVVPALIAQWATDQLRNNGVGITLGAATFEFVRMPDGTYVPPPGSTMSLSKDGSGNYFLSERHGSTLKFRAADGLLESVTDQHGNSSTYNYSGGKLSSISDCYSRALTFGWTGNRVTSVSDNTGRSVSFGYSAAGDLTTSTDPEGKAWYYDYNADHQIERLRDPMNRTITENTFDDEGRVIIQKSMGDNTKIWKLYYTGYINYEEDPTGSRRAFWYDNRGRPIGVGDALGNSSGMAYDGQDHVIVEMTPAQEPTFRTYDADNNLLTEQDALGETTRYFYDAQLRLQTVRDKRGHDTYYTHTAKHQIETVTDPEGNVTEYTYHPNGLPWTVTDGEQKTSTMLYDSWGGLQRVTAHDSTYRVFLNNARGDVLEESDEESRKTVHTYNNRRQLLTTTLPPVPGEPVAIIVHEYDNAGNLEKTTDAKGNIISHTYNSLAKHVTTTLPTLPAGNNVITTGYDIRDWPETVSNSLGHTVTTEYDAAQRAVKVRDQLERSTETDFDPNGRPVEIRNPLTHPTGFIWSARGEKTRTTNALGHYAHSTLDPNGNQTNLRNRRGKNFIFAYDDANRQTSITTPTGKTTLTTYWNNNLVKTITEPSTQQTTLAYNGKNLVSSKTDPTGTISYGYDDSGMLETVTEGATVITRTYDERGRLKSFTTADGDVIQYKYDASNNLARITYPPDASHPAGKQVNYTYNARNLLESVTDWNNRQTVYQYDRLGRLTGITRPNGTSAAMVHDEANQLISQREHAGNKLISYLRFDHDDAGQIKKRFRAPLVQSGWQHPAFTATYDDDNRLSTVNGQTVNHDADGNMTYGPIRQDSSQVNLTYNSRNQLTNADGISYTYDAEGRRRTLTDSTGTTRDVIDPNGGLSRLLIRHHPDNTKTYYIYGLGLLYEVDQAEHTKTYHFDQIGNTIARTDDTGKVIGKAEYSAYGICFWKQGDMTTPFLYNGQAGVQTDANGLLHMRARYYSPYLMRFLNADPSGFSGGPNWFAYADGNPISNTDPFGLCAENTSCTFGYTYGSGSAPYPTWSDLGPAIHGGLDIFGLVPGIGEFADGAGALIYLAEGNYTDAAIGGAAMIPFAGWGATGGKALRYGDEAFEIADGVRRAKAAQMAGLSTIQVDVYDKATSAFIESREVLIDQLLSPNKSVIDVRNLDEIERFAGIHDATLKGASLPPIQVNPGANGIPIPQIQFNYGR